MLAFQSNDYPLWKRVFEVVNSSNTIVNFNLNTEILFEGTNKKFYPEISVLGVFKGKSKEFVAVSFEYNASEDCINNVRHEAKDKFGDLTIVTEKEKAHIKSLV